MESYISPTPANCKEKKNHKFSYHLKEMPKKYSLISSTKKEAPFEGPHFLYKNKNFS